MVREFVLNFINWFRIENRELGNPPIFNGVRL